MTDERIGERLWEAIEGLPAGTGVVFRHYSLEADRRGALARRVAETCRARGLTLAIAGDVELAKQLGAPLVHNPTTEPGDLPFSRSAHSVEEAREACEAGASLIFLAPVFPTRSHPERAPLAREVARKIVAACPVPVVALGGVDRTRFEEIRRDGFYGWAGIDAWARVGPSRE